MAKITNNRKNKENIGRREKSQQITAKFLRELQMGQGKPLSHLSGKDVFKTREKSTGSFEVYDPKDEVSSKGGARTSVRASEPGYVKSRAISFSEKNPGEVADHSKDEKPIFPGKVRQRVGILDRETAVKAVENRRHNKDPKHKR